VWVRGGSPGHAREGSGSTGGGGGGKVPPGEEAAHRRRGLVAAPAASSTAIGRGVTCWVRSLSLWRGLASAGLHSQSQSRGLVACCCRVRPCLAAGAF
jgi:hypothetical protein